MEGTTQFRSKEIEDIIGYHFGNLALLRQAVTHSSFANEQKINKTPHYERLEFLGDAVLELTSSEFLYLKHPELPEGKLSKMRASMVCEPYLAFCAKSVGLEQYILLGKGEEATGGRQRESIISDVFEAIIGAIYLDGGIEEAKAYIYRLLLDHINEKKLFADAKSELQEMMQGKLKREFSYELLKVEGPEHCQVFTVQVISQGEILGEGQGKNKKLAEQQAAQAALERLMEE